MINLYERMLQARRGSNPRPPDHQSDWHPIEPPRPCLGGIFIGNSGIYFLICFFKNMLWVLIRNVPLRYPQHMSWWRAWENYPWTIINYSSLTSPITKTCLYNFDPLKPHFYIVKLGFTGIGIIFLFLLKDIDCGYSLEPPRRGGSNEYPQSMF